MPSKFFSSFCLVPERFPLSVCSPNESLLLLPRISENFLLSVSLFGVSEGFSSEGLSLLHVGFSRKFSLSL